MIKINNEDRSILTDLCSKRRNDPMLLWYLEGNRCCGAWVDNDVTPEEAVILAADFCYLLGNVQHPEEIREILMEEANDKIIVTCGQQWVDYINSYLSDRVYRFKRYSIKNEPDIFDPIRLNQFIHALEPGYEIKRIDEETYWKVVNIPWAADGCCFFRSYEDFEVNGLGYIICKGDQLVCIASSYTAYKGHITVTIGTLEEHRRKGLALACASRLILACLERNIYPMWEAANMESVALAEKLGYQYDNEYDVYALK